MGIWIWYMDLGVLDIMDPRIYLKAYQFYFQEEKPPKQQTFTFHKIVKYFNYFQYLPWTDFFPKKLH